MRELIDKYYPVLDHGFVALKDYMGNDEAVEQAARVSYGGGTRKVSETRGLLRYLMKHRHTTPFEMCEVKFHMMLPIVSARQMIRHRVFSFNEYSGRYSIMPNIYYTPDREHFATQSKNNKQGRGQVLDDETYDKHVAALENHRESVTELYHDMLEDDVARELARIDLPGSIYTQWYVKGNLHNWFHFLGLRLDSHAQYEIRVFADVIAGIIAQLFPISFEAFLDYRFNSVTFSPDELHAVRYAYESGSTFEEAGEDLQLSKRDVVELVKCMEKVPLTTNDILAKIPEPKSYEFFENKLKEATSVKL